MLNNSQIKGPVCVIFDELYWGYPQTQQFFFGGGDLFNNRWQRESLNLDGIKNLLSFIYSNTAMHLMMKDSWESPKALHFGYIASVWSY